MVISEVAPARVVIVSEVRLDLLFQQGPLRPNVYEAKCRKRCCRWLPAEALLQDSRPAIGRLGVAYLAALRSVPTADALRGHGLVERLSPFMTECESARSGARE